MRKRDKTWIDLLIDDLKTTDLRLRLADDMSDLDADEQRATAIQELEEIRDTLRLQIKNIWTGMHPYLARVSARDLQHRAYTHATGRCFTFSAAA